MRLRLGLRYLFAVLAGISTALLSQSTTAHHESVLFEAEQHGEIWRIAPVVRIRDGKASAAPSLCDQGRPEDTAFTRRYLRPGKKYRVLFGGADAGTLVVEKALEDDPYPVVLSSAVQRAEGSAALATDDANLGRRGESWRRVATPAEIGEATALARKLLSRDGAKAKELAKIIASQVTVLRIKENGAQLLVGSYEIHDDQVSDWSLFFIAALGGTSLTPQFEWHQNVKDDDNSVSLSLVDQVDLDGDGVDELIVNRTAYESGSYEVYKQSPTGWTRTLTTPRHGCL